MSARPGGMAQRMFRDAEQQAFEDGISRGAQDAGVKDPKTIASLQLELVAKYWDDFKDETSPTPSEAYAMGRDFLRHYIDHLAGRNTPEKLQELREASWAIERSRQRSNKATDAKFADSDAWAKTALPKLYARLKNGVGNRPSVTRFVLDRHTAAVEASERKVRNSGWMHLARNKSAVPGVRPSAQLLAGAGAEGAVALRSLNRSPLGSDLDAA